MRNGHSAATHLLIAGAALAFVTPAWAQTTTGTANEPAPATGQSAPATATAAPAATPGVGDIIVTAQRREQRLQDVPIAISAFNNATLEAKGVQNINGIANLAPNVKIVTSNRQSVVTIAIRGSGTANPAPSFEPAVGTYVDGVYLSKSYGSVFDLADIDHIEVLRGPQGTLYGRNTLAGAINIVTQKPTGVFDGNIKLGYGDYDHRLARASVDLPAWGPLSVKISGLFDATHGYVHVLDNPYPQVTTAAPRQNDRVGDQNRKALRFAARLHISDNLLADYTLDYSHSNDQLGYSQPTYVLPGSFLSASSPTTPFGLYVRPNTRQDVAYLGGSFGGADANSELTREQLHALTLTWSPGPVTIKSITSYRKLDHDWWNDTDGTPLVLVQSQMNLSYHADSQEFQATGKAGRLLYTGGLYYFYDSGYANNPQAYFGGTPFTGGYGFGTRSYAAYGQLEYTPPILEDKLTFIAGLRYSSERKFTSRNWRQGAIILVPVGTQAHATFHGWTPTFTAKYNFTPSLNAYFRYARGFKSGGFNGEATTVIDSITPYKQEEVTEYEAGLKFRAPGGGLTANVAVFHDVHTNLQLSVFGPTPNGGLSSNVRNAGHSTVDGVELELAARPVSVFQISGNLGYLDPKYQTFIDRNNVGVVTNVANDRPFGYAPRWTGGASGDLTIFKGDRDDLHLLADYSYSSSYYVQVSSLAQPTATIASAQTTKAGSLQLVDMRLQLTRELADKRSVQFAVWVKNLFDVSSRVGGVDFGTSFAQATVSFYNLPRTFGGDILFRF
jgi:iron complex outermembrane receptor protein